MRDRVPVLVAAGGETWEAPALRALAEASVVVLKRCVDLTDLLASASAGTVGVVLVSGELAGLDADAVMQLLRVDVRCVAVGGDAEALGRLGVVEVHPVDDPAGLPDAVRRAVRQDLVLDPSPGPRAGWRCGPTGVAPSSCTAPRGRRGARSWRRGWRPSTPAGARRPCWSTPTRTAAPWRSTSSCSTR